MRPILAVTVLSIIIEVEYFLHRHPRPNPRHHSAAMTNKNGSIFMDGPICVLPGEACSVVAPYL